MSIEPQHPHPSLDLRAVDGSSRDPLTQADAQERADIEEDRRRQRELFEAELGGEA